MQQGKTAVVWATFEGHNAMVDMLLEKGADPHEKDNVSELSTLSASHYY